MGEERNLIRHQGGGKSLPGISMVGRIIDKLFYQDSLLKLSSAGEGKGTRMRPGEKKKKIKGAWFGQGESFCQN